MSAELIKDVEDLKRRATRDPNTEDWMECFIQLGVGRSSKRVIYYPDSDTFDVHHEIDDTYSEDVTLDYLEKNTHIIEALEKNALYEYEFSVRR